MQALSARRAQVRAAILERAPVLDAAGCCHKQAGVVEGFTSLSEPIPVSPLLRGLISWLLLGIHVQLKPDPMQAAPEGFPLFGGPDATLSQSLTEANNAFLCKGPRDVSVGHGYPCLYAFGILHCLLSGRDGGSFRLTPLTSP